MTKSARIGRGLTRHNAKRHLAADIFDRNTKPIAQAWIAYRTLGVTTDRAMLWWWIDKLADEVIRAIPIRFWVRKYTVCILEIWRFVRKLVDTNRLKPSDERAFPEGLTILKIKEIYEVAACRHGVSTTKVRTIVDRVTGASRPVISTCRDAVRTVAGRE